ncbi:MAG: sigma-70 family RNA polymerase sigma factor [Deltaproteobacteria bacterium]|nr:sigma-70 family RNA polymerase sigma factor [Deltaproteobacteria bacterium]
MGPPAYQGAAADERALVARLRAGDRQAFADLIARHGGSLLRLATAIVRNRSSAEEVVQEAWLAALEGIDGFEGRAALRTWLFQIVANKARTRLRRDGRSVPFSALSSPDDGEDHAPDSDRFDGNGAWKDPPGRWSEEDPERLAQGVETRAAIERAIADLPAAQRAVITLRDVEGLEAEEICSLLDLTVANQRVLLHRARARVRLALEKHLAGGR